MPTKALPTFEVSKEGLAAQLARRPKAFIIAELTQNAWDEDSTQVDITLVRHDDGHYKLVVEDDNPEGFADLSHAYTLFAESAKKDDPEKRGRFNLGEKLVIALCDSVRITTTKGTVVFTEKGRYMLDQKRPSGSVFEAILPMTEAEADEAAAFLATMIVPTGVTTTFNFSTLPARQPIAVFEASLRTERADADGRLKPTTRKTVVEVYEPVHGEVPSIYELGIPVVDTGDRFHVNVMQKVPLNMDRDNVPPAYLRDLRTEVLNATFDLLSDEDAKASWVSNAMEDENASPDAIKAAFSKRFGNKAVIFDPNDPEANKLAAAAGYTVVPGGALPKAAWKNVKSNDVALPAGKVTPSPDPNGAEKIERVKHLTGPVQNVVDFAVEFGERLLGFPVQVVVVNDTQWPFNATYGSGTMTLNLGALGFKFFDTVHEGTINLFIHEFAHEGNHDHLSEDFWRTILKLAAKTWRLALDDPGLFERYGATTEVVAA